METVVHHFHRRHPSFKCVRQPCSWRSHTLTQFVLRTFASAAPSNMLPQMMEQFGFGKEVATLTVSLFIAGYCVGPLVWGPLSEDVSYL